LVVYGRGFMAADPLPAHLGASAEDYQRLGLKQGQVEPWEDGARTDGGKGTYEWWYFDSHLNDGSKLVIHFATKPITDPSQPLTPEIRFSLDRPDGSTVTKTLRAPAQEFSAAKDQAKVVIGKNTFEGDLNTYKIHLDGEGILADITLKGQVPAWRPETGHWFYGANDEHYFAWLPAVPQGQVEATITVDGQTQQYTGTGYHDHNWGNYSMISLMNNWYWGRAEVGGYTVVASFITAEKKYGYKQFPIFMLAKDGKIVADNGNNVQFSTGDRYIDSFTGKPVDNKLVYDYKDGDQRYVVQFDRHQDIVRHRFADDLTGITKVAATLAGFDGAYLRFTGDVSLERFEGTTLKEQVKAEALWELMYFGKSR
jgi:predicted secreted hydrolase